MGLFRKRTMKDRMFEMLGRATWMAGRRKAKARLAGKRRADKTVKRQSF